jgi:predicted nucleic acid-binding protein
VNVVDSSGWIEYLSGGSNAAFFRKPIESTEPLVVPSLSLFEVYRHMLRHVGREEALNVVAAMRSGTVVDLDDRLALEAAELSVETKLALADSIILATALWQRVAQQHGGDEETAATRRQKGEKTKEEERVGVGFASPPLFLYGDDGIMVTLRGTWD